jgi:hypothetical protein
VVLWALLWSLPPTTMDWERMGQGQRLLAGEPAMAENSNPVTGSK